MISYILSFLIVAFGQPSWCSWLAPVAAVMGYALLWKGRPGFWKATIWFTAVQFIQLSWMTAIDFHGVYIVFVYLGLSFWLGVQFGAISLLVRQRLNLLRILAVASLWTLLEWSRLHILCGFSFNPVGLALAAYVPSMQLAAVFGVFGLSFWVMFVNLTLLSRRLALWGGLALFPYLFGLFHLQYQTTTSDKELRVALVQTGLLPSEKMPLGGRLEAFVSPYDQWRRVLHALKWEKKADWDLIVLPEAALPFTAERPIYRYEIVKKILQDEKIHVPESTDQLVSNKFWMQALAEHFNAHLVVGLDGEDIAENKVYSAAYHLSPNAVTYNRYEKRVLVPLAEYLPFAWLKPFVAAYGISQFFTHGVEAKVFAGPVPFSPSICYEETFPHLMREGRVKGAELFINLTNDNWYPASRLSRQHFDLGRLRSVENGVPLLRACNSGVTAVIDSVGNLLAEFEGKAGVLNVTFKPHSHNTLYSLYGDVGIVSLSLLFLLFFISRLVLPKKFKLS
jgi:apolipoprotein N-acyltransferase